VGLQEVLGPEELDSFINVLHSTQKPNTRIGRHWKRKNILIQILIKKSKAHNAEN
jgi:hypothetical protein